eukprot:TRINITY_DN4172_c0_g1_i1.p1 TRINITY_DN4172_c0_g1~~TRINITY_DN4172_c0_g1_i1.p1  ORF type:complete len:1321 (+),score=199.44 TRINITY_DN4172_c0_g1_i1:307-4269(+)
MEAYTAILDVANQVLQARARGTNAGLETLEVWHKMLGKCGRTWCADAKQRRWCQVQDCEELLRLTSGETPEVVLEALVSSMEMWRSRANNLELDVWQCCPPITTTSPVRNEEEALPGKSGSGVVHGRTRRLSSGRDFVDSALTSPSSAITTAATRRSSVTAGRNSTDFIPVTLMDNYERRATAPTPPTRCSAPPARGSGLGMPEPTSNRLLKVTSPRASVIVERKDSSCPYPSNTSINSRRAIHEFVRQFNATATPPEDHNTSCTELYAGVGVSAEHEEANGPWTCQVCSFVNNGDRPSCKICDSPMVRILDARWQGSRNLQDTYGHAPISGVGRRLSTETPAQSRFFNDLADVTARADLLAEDIDKDVVIHYRLKKELESIEALVEKIAAESHLEPTPMSAQPVTPELPNEQRRQRLQSARGRVIGRRAMKETLASVYNVSESDRNELQKLLEDSNKQQEYEDPVIMLLKRIESLRSAIRKEAHRLSSELIEYDKWKEAVERGAFIPGPRWVAIVPLLVRERMAHFEQSNNLQQIIKLQRRFLVKHKAIKNERAFDIAEPFIVKELSDKQMRMRINCLHEVLHTERTYVQNLTCLIQSFMNPMLELEVLNIGMITADEVERIFSNIIVIHQFNQLLLNELEAQFHSSPDIEAICLGPTFARLAPFLKMYTQYVNNYSNSLRTLATCKNRRPFRMWLSKIMKQTGTTLDIGAYLIQPIQRLPRYVLLLTDLIKYTPNNHPDFEALRGALQKMREVTHTINDARRTAENLEKVFQVHMALTEQTGGDDLPNLVEPHRIYVCEGAMYKVKYEGGKAEPAKRNAYLFNDLLLTIDTDVFKTLSLSLSVGTVLMGLYPWRVDDLVPLLSASLIQDPEDTGDDLSFMISYHGGVSLLALAFASRQERDIWWNQISAQITQLLKSNIPHTVSLEGVETGSEDNWEAVKQGWLTKQGGFVPSWKRRWFVLHSYALLYYQSELDNVPLGTINLRRYKVAQLNDSKREFCFELYPKRRGERSYYIAADTLQEYQQWFKLLQTLTAQSGVRVKSRIVAPAASVTPTRSSAHLSALIRESKIFSSPEALREYYANEDRGSRRGDTDSIRESRSAAETPSVSPPMSPHGQIHSPRRASKSFTSPRSSSGTMVDLPRTMSQEFESDFGSDTESSTLQSADDKSTSNHADEYEQFREGIKREGLFSSQNARLMQRQKKSVAKTQDSLKDLLGVNLPEGERDEAIDTRLARAKSSVNLCGSSDHLETDTDTPPTTPSTPTQPASGTSIVSADKHDLERATLVRHPLGTPPRPPPRTHQLSRGVSDMSIRKLSMTQ